MHGKLLTANAQCRSARREDVLHMLAIQHITVVLRSLLQSETEVVEALKTAMTRHAGEEGRQNAVHWAVQHSYS